MKSFIYPYRKGSKSVKALSQAINAKCIKLEDSKFKVKEGRVVVNWGSSSCPYPCLNRAEAVNTAADKLLSFKAMAEYGVSVPDFTDQHEVANHWPDDWTIVTRASLRGSGGEGIGIVPPNHNMWNAAPLYVKYISKKDEYRVHVMNGEVIDVQRKMRNRAVADGDVNWKVRNHANGFVFGREGVELPDDAAKESIAAVKALGLDFGAVDIIYNEKENKCYVLEVNTAPGLEGTTIEKYKEGLQRNYL